MKIIKKAYKVWHEGMLDENPYEGYTIDSLPITYANTPGEAKQNASEIYDYEIDSEPHKYTDLKVRRAKGGDWLLLEDGEKIRRYALEHRESEKIRIQKRIDKVNSFPDNSNFYIQNGYVGNSVLWWGLRSSGYTTDLSKAQLYTKDEVLKNFVNGRVEDLIWNAKHVLENIKQHVDGQYLRSEHQA